jgi:hypothetical protein
MQSDPAMYAHTVTKGFFLVCKWGMLCKVLCRIKLHTL